MKADLKMKKILFVSLLVGTLFSCDKQDYPEDWKPGSGELTIQMDKTSIKQSEFFTLQFGGYADSIMVYDGTLGHEYRYKDRTAMEGVKPKVSFTSYMQWGAQTNSLSVLVSTDFAGDKYDATEIQAATWTNITNRFTLSTGADNTVSGEVNLADLVKPGKQMYFAFKYEGKTGSTQRQWTIKNFVIKNELPTGVVQDVVNTASAGWKQYSVANSAKVWTYNTTQVGIEGGNATSEDNLDWVITKALDFTKVAPDQPSHMLKTRFENMLQMYRVGYKSPGQYKMTVIGKENVGKETGKLEKDVTVQAN